MVLETVNCSYCSMGDNGMKRMRNNLIILSLIAATLVLTGCGKLNDYVQNEVTKAS